MIGLATALLLSSTVSFTLDGVEFQASLQPERQRPLVVRKGGKTVAEAMRKEWNPWRLEAADVDGDGKQDLIVGIVKATRYLPDPHTTIFVYGFNGERIDKKWLGSTMGRDLVDFDFGPPEKKGMQPLYTLENTLDRKTALSKYFWNGFGFRKLPGEMTWPKARNLKLHGDTISLTVSGKRLSFPAKDGPWFDSRS